MDDLASADMKLETQRIRTSIAFVRERSHNPFVKNPVLHLVCFILALYSDRHINLSIA